MDRAELAAWLRLAITPRFGRDSARRLLAAFGSAQAVLEASPAALREVVSAPIAAALATVPPDFNALVEQTARWLGRGSACERALITLADTSYPAALLQTADPPLFLHAEGWLAALSTSSLAIVGSRRPTAQGLAHARRFGRELGEAGYVVVSGLALGIDSAAHEGALESSAGTVAVVGTGLDQTYPRRNLDLARRILAGQGLLLSEYALGTPPLANNFPQRNRLIAGLSLGTLVVEAALQSGSLITARLASEAGREVFAIPGSIHSAQSSGCHALIKQGAKLVECTADVLEEFGAVRHRVRAMAAPEAPAADPLLDAMGYDPVSIDALVARTGASAPVLSVRLLELELAGAIARLPGPLFQRCGRG